MTNKTITADDLIANFVLDLMSDRAWNVNMEMSKMRVSIYYDNSNEDSLLSYHVLFRSLELAAFYKIARFNVCLAEESEDSRIRLLKALNAQVEETINMDRVFLSKRYREEFYEFVELTSSKMDDYLAYLNARDMMRLGLF